jgi:hypothetical protein
MKKLRLLFLAMVLVSGFWSFNQRVVACVDPDEEILGPVCPKQQPRPNGCPCCSDNHCTSNYCNPTTNKCGDRPLGE